MPVAPGVERASPPYTPPVDDWLRRNPITVSLGLGSALFIAWIFTREPVALMGALILFVVAVLGDRLNPDPPNVVI